ncbi:hypothetical protein [Mesorhizobium amorphae]|uniref:hypothetical protein n=1 Tax=Mesorhizobium amorphae TaxID=71433 RepID=UPI001FED46C0|nr:hypothetical protein [Mesorhizobium amorphae]
MDRNFSRALALVLKSKGGWLDNQVDPSGATMKGVTPLPPLREGGRQQGGSAQDQRWLDRHRLPTVLLGRRRRRRPGRTHRFRHAYRRGQDATGEGIDKFCDNRLAWLKRLPTWPTFGRG